MFRRALRMVVVFTAVILLLAFWWLLLPSTRGASASPEADHPGSRLAAGRQPLPPPPTPDPRWLALVRSSPLSALPHQQASSASININLTDGFVAGHVALANPVVISATRLGAQVAQATTIPILDESGFFYLAYLGWENCSPCVLQAGDVVWVSQAASALSMTVPTLSGLAAPETDIVYGQAPANAPLTVYLFPFAAPEAIYTRTLTADGTGNYQALWTPEVDLRPRDRGYVAYAQDSSRQAYARFVAPFLRAQAGGLEVSGMAAPFSSVVITVTDAAGTPLTSLYAYAYSDGSFELPPYYYGGCDKGCGGGIQLQLQPGDRLTAEAAGQTFSMTVLTLTAHADLTNGQVWGEATAGQPVEVLRFGGPLQSAYDDIWAESPADQVTTTAAAGGAYTTTLPLSRRDYGAAVVTSPEGHQTYARFAVPYLWVRMGEEDAFPYLPPYAAWGQVDDPAAPITLAVQGPSGYLKGLRSLVAADNGYFTDYPYYYTNEPVVLDSGDIITLTTPRGVQVALALPQLTAQAYPISGTVSGLAPPGAQLTINIYDWPYGKTSLPPDALRTGGGGGGDSQNTLTLVVTATAEGEYHADFSALGGFSNHATGEALYTTPEGHTVARGFQALPHCALSLDPIQVGGNALTIRTEYGCPGALLRLRNAQGQVKAEQQIFPNYYYP